MTVRQDRIRTKMEKTQDPQELAQLEAELAKEKARPARNVTLDKPVGGKTSLGRLVLDKNTKSAMDYLTTITFEDGRRWEKAKIRRRAICELAERLGWKPPD